MSVSVGSDLEAIPFERFDAFHAAFDGEGNGMWDICAQCGGRCEQHKVGTLMPGEKAYIAHQLGVSLTQLENQYLDRLVTPRGSVDVLKLKPGCPFLDDCYHCTLADVKIKPVLCEIYPVMVEVHAQGTAEAPELSVEFLVDELDCPLMHATYQWAKHHVRNPRYQEYRTYFQTKGIERLERVGAPAAWYWIVEQYDNGNFDYHALARLRKTPGTAYETFTLDQLLACSIEP